VARGRRASSAPPEDATDTPLGAPSDGSPIDPLRIASEGLEDVEEEPDAQPQGPADTDEATPDPLALLSLAIDEEQDALAAGDDEQPRRRIFGRLARGRDRQLEAPAADEPEQSAGDLVEPVEIGPRVTTWAEDYADLLPPQTQVPTEDQSEEPSDTSTEAAAPEAE
jgi:hypothetical protein